MSLEILIQQNTRGFSPKIINILLEYDSFLQFIGVFDHFSRKNEKYFEKRESFFH